MKPKFSVIIPTHNEGDWLKKTVYGVLDNTNYTDFEIVVVADGCTDNSTEFIKNKETPKSVILVENKRPLGLPKTKNIGAKKATGDLFVFIDSHMIPLTKNWLSELAKVLEKKTVGAASIKIPNLENLSAVACRYSIKDFALEPDWIASLSEKEAHQTPVIPGGCFAIRSEVFESTGGFDDALRKWGREDLEFSIRLWRLGYDLIFSPNAKIGHSWERERTFEVSWEQVNYNIIRIVLLLFSSKYQKKVFLDMEKVHKGHCKKYLKELHEDRNFYKRQKDLNKKMTRSFEDYLDNFKEDLLFLSNI